MVIIHRQEIGRTGLEPALRGAPLALGAVPITAGVVGDLGLRAGTAAQRVPTEGGAAAVLNGRHDLELAETEGSPLGLPPGRPVGAEDVRDLQAWHQRALRGSGTLQRTEHFTQGLGGHLSIDRLGLELLVSEPDLTHPDIFPLLVKVGGKAYAPLRR